MSRRVLFSMNLSVSWPVMASIRRTPLATENSLTMRRADLRGVVGGAAAELHGVTIAHINDADNVAVLSPKSAIAPILRASAMGISFTVMGKPSSTASFTMRSTEAISSAFMAEKWVKSKRRRSGSTSEPA